MEVLQLIDESTCQDRLVCVVEQRKRYKAAVGVQYDAWQSGGVGLKRANRQSGQVVSPNGLGVRITYIEVLYRTGLQTRPYQRHLY